MIYLKDAAGRFRLIVLETANLDELKQGHPVKSPDLSVMVAWTPDPGWLAEQIRASDGDFRTVARLIDEAAKRPVQPLRPYFDPEEVQFDAPPPEPPCPPPPAT